MRLQLLKAGEPLTSRSGDFLLVYEEGSSIIYDNLIEIPKYPIVLGRCLRSGRIEEVGRFPDITERAELGPIRIYLWDYLESIEAIKYGNLWEYYARLKLYSQGKRHLVLEKPISSIERLENFGRLHSEAFKYLQYSQSFEMDVERIFYEFLKSINAYLERPLHHPIYERPYKPYVSVIIPTKNRHEFIEKTLESLLENDFDKWECTVVDNGSTDGTDEVVMRFSSMDKRIKLVRVSGKTLAECLNEGVKNSRGWIVAQLDSDDLYTRDAIRSIYEFHRENDVGLGISYYELIDEEGKKIEEIQSVKHLEFSINNVLRVEGAGAVRTYKREILERVGGFDEKNFPNFGEDYDLVLRICERFKVGRIHKTLYLYRRHSESTDAKFPVMEKKRTKTAIRWSAIRRRRIINSTKSVSLI